MSGVCSRGHAHGVGRRCGSSAWGGIWGGGPRSSGRHDPTTSGRGRNGPRVRRAAARDQGRLPRQGCPARRGAHRGRSGGLRARGGAPAGASLRRLPGEAEPAAARDPAGRAESAPVGGPGWSGRAYLGGPAGRPAGRPGRPAAAGGTAGTGGPRGGPRRRPAAGHPQPPAARHPAVSGGGAGGPRGRGAHPVAGAAPGGPGGATGAGRGLRHGAAGGPGPGRGAVARRGERRPRPASPTPAERRPADPGVRRSRDVHRGRHPLPGTLGRGGRHRSLQHLGCAAGERPGGQAGGPRRHRPRSDLPVRGHLHPRELDLAGIRRLPPPVPRGDAGGGGREREHRSAVLPGRLPLGGRGRSPRCRSGTPGLVQQLRGLGRPVRPR